MINPQALSQFLSTLECVLLSSLRQVISETHSLLKTQLPCYKQMEGSTLVGSSSGILPDLFGPESEELLASWVQMTVSAEALISPPPVFSFPAELLCWCESEKLRLAPTSQTQRWFLYSRSFCGVEFTHFSVDWLCLTPWYLLVTSSLCLVCISLPPSCPLKEGRWNLNWAHHPH